MTVKGIPIDVLTKNWPRGGNIRVSFCPRKSRRQSKDNRLDAVPLSGVAFPGQSKIVCQCG